MTYYEATKALHALGYERNERAGILSEARITRLWSGLGVDVTCHNGAFEVFVSA